ncbi:MAG: RDD family protein [Myxococcaceae bacterium]
MSDQKKPPVPSFEELQAQQRARDATVKGPAPAAPAAPRPPGQLDPRLMKTTPAAPNPALLNQTKTGIPTSRLDADMLSRLATGGLSAGGYQKGNLEPTHMGPMPKPPGPDERTQVARTPGVPPAPAAPPRAGVPAGQPSSMPVSKPPSIPTAPASLSSRPPVPQGPPPKMPAPPPPGAAAAPRAPTQPPMPARPATNPPMPALVPRAPANPPLPAAAPRAPSVPPPAYAPRAAAPPNPPASNTPASLRAPGAPIPGSTVSMRQGSNVPPPPSHSPTLSRQAVPPAPAPAPVSAQPAKPLGDPSGYSATFLRPVTEPNAPKVPVAASPQPPTEVVSNPTHKVNRAELQEMFDELPTTPRVPVPQPKVEPVRLESPARAAVNEALDDRTPLQVRKPEAQRPISSPLSSEDPVQMPHLDRPPALNSKSLLDVSPVVTPASGSAPMNRSETVNLRPPSRDELDAVQPPRPSITPPHPAPPQALVEIPPEERTPIKVNAAFATTQPGVPGPFAKKGQRATDFAVTPVDADAHPGHELAPTTDVGGLDPVTLNQTSGPSSLGEAFDPSGRSDEVPALETQMRPVKGELVAAPAGLLRRCFSFLVDFVIVGGLCVGLLMAASVVKGVKAVPAHLSDLDILLYRAHALDKLLIPSLALCALVVLVYATVFASALGGRTPGRLLTGVRLVTTSGEPPGLGRALLRAVFSFVSFGLCLGGFWLALFDRKGQTLHDKLTRTFVVRPL